MSSPHGDMRRTSSSHGSTRRDVSDDPSTLSITRTRSQEVNVAESVAAAPPIQTIESQIESSITKWPASTKFLILLCAFLTSLVFGITQVPLLYVFRLMTCDAYYEKHSSSNTNTTYTSITSALEYTVDFYTVSLQTSTYVEKDRCSLHAIEASTALSLSLLGASTTLFGLMNLFLTGNLIKRIGVKPTLLIQTFFPALRLLVQNIGVEVWGSLGIIIVQLSQIVSVIGGPSGYLLALNTYITEVVDYEERTAALGRLSGSMMFGSAIGFLLGGVTAETFGIKFPFRMTLAGFLLTCVYVAIFLPHIPPAEKTQEEDNHNTKKNRRNVCAQYFGPLLVFSPRKFRRRDGTIITEYGAFLLAWGVYIGILATGYIPTLLQLYATDVFQFGTQQNGGLIFMYSMLRGVFLTFAFPELIKIGRKWTSKSIEKDNEQTENTAQSERSPLLRRGSSNVQDNTSKPSMPEASPKKEQTFTFDLTYTRFSLLADGLLTLLCSLVHQGWQMYLVAAVLPFAAGTGSAAKGTVLQMVGSSATSAERTDALAGVSLVENMARLSTTFAFGVIFAAFAAIGRTELVFTCNAAAALIGFAVLIFARFPPDDSERLDRSELQEQESQSARNTTSQTT